MQQAIPYKTLQQLGSINTPPTVDDKMGMDSSNISPWIRIRTHVSENAVLVLGRRGCCMSHVVKLLLLGLGVNPVMYEVKEDEEVVQELSGIFSAHQTLQFPLVFIGGRLVGGLDRLMALHISGDLVPILKEAGALWL